MASERDRSTESEHDSPAERFEEFKRENGEWSRKVEESLTELEELAGEETRDREEAEERTGA